MRIISANIGAWDVSYVNAIQVPTKKSKLDALGVVCLKTLKAY
jgi:hypothetical protein